MGLEVTRGPSTNYMPDPKEGFPGGAVVKNLLANAGDTRDASSIPGWGKTPGEGSGNTLQYSCLENAKDQKSLAGYSLWGRQESHTTEHTTQLQQGQRKLMMRAYYEPETS